MECKSSVWQLEIVNRDRLLLGEYNNYLELVDVATMKSLHNFKLESWITQILKADDEYLVATGKGVIKVQI